MSPQGRPEGEYRSAQHEGTPVSPLRVLVVDDEALARARLARLVAECPAPPCVVVGEAGNAAQALVRLAERGCDVMLVDIHMPGRDGLQLAAEAVALAAPPVVVFVTADAGHALAAFDLDAADYLTKPVRRERLQAALQRAAQRLSARSAPASGSAPAGEPVLVVGEAGRVLRIPVADVLYLKAELKYVTLRTAAATHILDDPLNDLEQRLGDRFLRVHRNALVARHAMRALERHGGGSDDDAGEGWAVRVHPVGEWLAVSRRQLAAVREAMSDGSGR